jgi:NOL1/NOP2/sun family putative RNA methylase
MTLPDLPLPARFLERMERLLGQEFTAFREALERPALQGVRINTLKASTDAVVSLLPWELHPVPWCPSGFTVPEDARPGKHPLHAAGVYYVQEPSAMAVADALDVQPGHAVLDLAASPGGKATHIAALLQHRGVLVANDLVAGRIKPLGENIERCGVRNAVILNAVPQTLASAMPGAFNRVLVDAPCSGEGMFRRGSVARREWSEEHVEGCAVRQERLLDDAARMVKSGGTLLYSTCTFAPEENERQVARFLERNPGWELVDIPKTRGRSPGRPEWADGPQAGELERMARIWPHRADGEGHTLALLRAPEEPLAASPERRREVAPEPPTRAAITIWEAFRAEHLPGLAQPGTLVQRGHWLFLAPEGAPDPGSLRLVRPGLPLGEVRGSRFTPAHALALAFPGGAFSRAIEVSEPDAVRYLRGEPLRESGPAGWLVVTHRGFPLGWGKRSGGVVKNHYPRGLRWLR